MEKHNFKVQLTFATVVLVIFLLFGQIVLAFGLFLIYFLYALFVYIKGTSYRSKWNKMFDSSVDEEVKEMVLCCITQRSKKLDKKLLKILIDDINNKSIQ